MRKIFNLLLIFITFTLFAPGNAGAASLCAEKIDQNYVNVMMMNDVFGAGLDEVFEVVIRRVRPRTEAELDRLKAFYYFEGKDELGYSYPDGREYRWQLENNEYRLYKLVAGKDPERIEVYKAAFPTTQKILYQLRLLKSNPRVYKELGLDNKLDALGLMGVTFRGGRGALDFINSVSLASGTDTPKVVVKNANTVLYRYALASGFEGTSRQVSYDEFHGPLGFKILMERMGEQEILDTYFGELLTAAGEKDDRYANVNTIGGSSPANINGISENEIKYIYVPCKASGNDIYGSAKAAFIPVKIADDKGSSFYPVFVFPTAFSNLESLNKSIRRELYHARWWNAAANLTDVLAREAFMRQSAPHIELDIFEKLKFDPQYAEFAQMYASLRLLLHYQLKSVTGHPEKLRYDFPWTLSAALIKPNGMYGQGTDDMVDDIGSRYYNKVFAQGFKTIDDFTIAFCSPSSCSKEIRKKMADDLINALAHGYSLSKEKRNAQFGMAAKSGPLYLGYLDGMDQYKPGWKWAENTDQAFSLIDSVGTKGYGFGDLEWTFKIMPAFFSDQNGLFYKRFNYLIKTAKVIEISGIADLAKEPFVISADQETADIKVLLDSMKDKGDKALQKIVNNAFLEADKKAAKQKEIVDLNTEIKELLTKHEGVAGDFKQANKDYLDALNGYDTATEAAYSSMTGQCMNSLNYKPDKKMKPTHIYNQYLNVLDVKNAECTSAIDNFIKVRDDGDTAKDRNALFEVQLAKLVEYEKLRSEITEDDALLTQAQISENPIDATLASNIKKINKSKKKEFKTWGDYARAAFSEYFNGNGVDVETFKSSEDDDKAAFEVLEKKLSVIKGVSIVKGGAQ